MLIVFAADEPTNRAFGTWGERHTYCQMHKLAACIHGVPVWQNDI
jgi:hypothetical protein